MKAFRPLLVWLMMVLLTGNFAVRGQPTSAPAVPGSPAAASIPGSKPVLAAESPRALASALVISDPNAAEVEQLLAVFIHLGLCDYAVELIGEYYDGPQRPRTPIADFYHAQALLLRHELGQVAQLAEGPGMTPAELAEKQQKNLTAAANRIDAGLSTLRKQADSIPGSRYARLLADLTLLRARVALAQGDVGLRLQSVDLFTQAKGARTNVTSLSYYAKARQDVYQALLIKETVEGLVLADTVSKRVAWITGGRFFGGLAYFEVGPYLGSRADPGEGNYARGYLTSLLKDGGSLDLVNLNWATERKANVKRAIEISEQLRNQAEREQRRRKESVQSLTQQIFELQQEIGRIDSAHKALLSEQSDRLRILLLDDTNRMAMLTARVDELRQRAEATTSEIAVKLEELSNIGREKELQGLVGVSYRQLTNELLRADRETEAKRGQRSDLVGLLPRLKEVTELLRKNGRPIGALDKSLERVSLAMDRLKENGQSALKAAEIRINQAKAQLGQAEAKAQEEAVLLLKNAAQKKRQALQEAIGTNETALLDLQKQLLDTKLTDQSKIDDLKQQLGREIVKELEAGKKAITDAIGTVRSRIDTAERYLKDFSRTAEKVDQVMAAAKAAIIAAGSIPNGIIAGTSSGTFTSMGDSLIEAAKAGVEVIRHAEAVLQNVEDAKHRIDSLKSSLSQYEEKLHGVTAEKVKAEINNSIARLRSQGGNAMLQLEGRMAERQRDIQQKLTGITKIDDEILGVERQQIELLVTQAKSKVEEFMASVELAEHSRERERDKARSVSMDLAALMARMRDLDGEINALLQTRLQVVTEAQSSRTNTERAQLDRTESLSQRDHAIQARIDSLEEQIRLVGSEKATISGIGPAVELLRAEAIGPSASVQTRELRDKLDVANKLLFEYANWLYMLTGDREALKWAIWSDNKSDAKTVWLKLLGIDQQQVQTRLEHGNVKYFGVRMTRDQLMQRGASDANGEVALFTVAPYFPRQRIVSEDFGLPTGEKITIDFPMEHWPQLLFSPDLGDVMESARLLDVFIMPTWGTNADVRVTDRINIEAVGPSVAVVDGELKEFRIQKVYEDAQGNVLPYFTKPSASTQTQKAVADRHTALKVGSPNHQSLFERPAANFVLVAGRGLGNTWRLTFPAGGDQPMPGRPGLKDLESLTVVFSYVVSGLGTGVNGLKPSPVLGVSVPPMIGPVIPDDDMFRGQLAEYQRSTALPSFSEGPAGRLSRLKLLWRSSQLLAGYDQLSSESLSPETLADKLPLPLNEEQRRFGANTNLMSVFAPSHGNTVPGQPVSAELRSLTHQIVGEEMLRGELDDKADPIGRILGTISIGEMWFQLSSILGTSNDSATSILSQLVDARLNLQAASDNLNDIARALKPVRSLVGRVNDDLSVYDAQREIMTSLVGGLRIIAANKPVEAELRQRVARLKPYQSESGWIRQWSQKGDQTAEQLQLYRLDKALQDLGLVWDTYLLSPRPTSSSSEIIK